MWKMSVGELSVWKMLVGELSVGEMSVWKMSVGELSVGDTSVRGNVVAPFFQDVFSHNTSINCNGGHRRRFLSRF